MGVRQSLTYGYGFARNHAFSCGVESTRGCTQRPHLLTGTASLNTATGGGDILTVPSIFVRLQAPGSDANFARYDAVNGVMEHNVPTVATLAASSVAISSGVVCMLASGRVLGRSR